MRVLHRVDVAPRASANARARAGIRASIPLCILLGLSALGGLGPVAAQRGKNAPQEFVRQGLLIVNFAPGAGADYRLGRNAGNAVRSHVTKLVNRREVDVIDGNDIEYGMQRAGYNPDTTFSVGDIHAMGRYLRGDEYLLARVAHERGMFRLSGVLVLLRDEQLRQPLPDAVAPKLDSAAQLFARSLMAAREQLAPQRRCENALRDRSPERAIAAVRPAIAEYPRSTIARTCLVWALRQSGAPASDVLDAARQVLAVDSMSVHSLEEAATALDTLHQTGDAATMWLRLAATDTNDVDLALRVSYALLDGGSSKRAEPFLAHLSHTHPDDLRLAQLLWRSAFENKSWHAAIGAAVVLLARDSAARADSTFYLRLATAYHSVDEPYHALETLAHGVSGFPGDARLYALYAQYVTTEADTVVPRGLVLFPRSAGLLAMNGKQLRAKGKLAESLDATKQALALDSTMTQGQLMLAQLQVELGRPDSALASLHRALVVGEDTSLVAQFALAKGNAMYRAANGTKASADFAMALRFLGFADTVHATTQSKFLVGAAALGVAQSAFTEATQVKDKTESCRLARLGADMIPLARSGLQAGQEAFADAARQSLDYVQQLDPYATQALTTWCDKS